MKLIAITLLLFLTGCATHSTLTVSSQPSGAYITEIASGKAYGLTPFVVKYDAKAMTGYKDATGCYLVRGFDAKWISGASATSGQTIRLCGGNTGAYTYQFSRDTNTPGLEKDIDFAMKQSAIRAQQQQAQAAQDAAMLQAFSIMQASQPKPIQAPPPPAQITPFTCNSYSLGSQVQTNCR